MYRVLVTDPDDVLGALAYTAYKRHQDEVMTKIEQGTGQPPTQLDYETFFQMTNTPASTDMYLQRAEALINAFMTEILEERADELESQYAATATAETLKAIRSQQDAIRTKQDEKRTWRGWVADSLGNLAVNFVTILLIAGVVAGVTAIDSATGIWKENVAALFGTRHVPPAAQPVSPAR
jgi:hypothetical protein